jgi:hypothetical protein
LYTVKQLGAKVSFFDGERRAAVAHAQQLAQEKHLIYIEPLYNKAVSSDLCTYINVCPCTCVTPLILCQFSVIGAATVALEIVEQQPELDTIVLPLRLYSVGWTVIYGVAFFIKVHWSSRDGKGGESHRWRSDFHVHVHVHRFHCVQILRQNTRVIVVQMESEVGAHLYLKVYR